MREGCYTVGSKSKTDIVSIKSAEHEGQFTLQETDAYKKLAKKRYKIGAKNSEIKIPNGYNSAKSAG